MQSMTMRLIVTDVALSVCASVCLSVCLCLLVTTASRTKTGEPIEMPFGACTWATIRTVY